MSHKTITINGRLYDAVSGMPLAAPKQQTAPTHQAAKPVVKTHSQAIHQAPQKSQTLNRRTVKKSHAVSAPHQATAPAHHKSPAITKFAPHAPHTHAVAPTPSRKVADIAPVAHPAVARAHHAMQTKKVDAQPATPPPAHVIKQAAISEALAKAPAKTDQLVRPPRRHGRLAGIASASLALLLLGGYFTYLNMPNLSVRVAAAQSGINASYPDYKPDGYSLNGPIGYGDGRVNMKFAANAGPQAYTVSQSKSGWDSSAVLDNYVKQKAGDNYITYNERGLTIYTFDGNAAWVNGGILYTIDGNAPLSSDQIRRIAVSM